jgi:hypothetical protein
MAVSLASIKRSGFSKPPIAMVYAVHGIGKTTFGACAPNPIFIQTEDGLGAIEAGHLRHHEVLRRYHGRYRRSV